MPLVEASGAGDWQLGLVGAVLRLPLRVRLRLRRAAVIALCPTAAAEEDEATELLIAVIFHFAHDVRINLCSPMGHWRPIRHCRGRYCLVTSNSRLPVSALISDTPGTICRVRAARDPVLVVEFEGGGPISYLREDGTLMHTLNTSEGFRRKLRQLGIEPEA